MLTIVPFESKYAQSFKELNLAWITEYFKVEDKDKELLENCEASIIKKGGYIFISLWNNEPVGCFTLLKQTEEEFELGKMAVSKAHQGLRIGQHMLTFAIDFSKKRNWKKIVLYSSTKLDTALHIYKKFGFKEVELEKNLIYIRSDIKMELTL
ncbi:GNAT family N-acetyltransferase [Maribacter sp. X9]|uniref:GNAT family N-acetyltransferase n=1 Tax=Maribacter sp. X9 TaxID=3402159 RepID=UPI003AF3FE56